MDGWQKKASHAFGVTRSAFRFASGLVLGRWVVFLRGSFGWFGWICVSLLLLLLLLLLF